MPQRSHLAHLSPARITLAFLLLLILWDQSNLDLLLAQSLASPHGFALRHHWLLTSVLHEGGRLTAGALMTAACVAIWWPFGPFRRIPVERRWQLVLTVLLSLLGVSLLKSFSASSCPWDLAEFGGVARHLSNWAGFFESDGGSGRCFPAGHAASGFAFLGGWFAFRRDAPRTARIWLIGALFAGLGLGAAQQLRGAHFMSHTLWTAWLCGCIAWLTDEAAALLQQRTAGALGKVA